ncbi:MAG TPA: YeeE/YedE family protein [Labilithrix sp.]|nr:YeeE/YedE family protein [Labilithrix sp.]
MHDFTPVPALIGGALIGLAASLFLLAHGRTAGISGLFLGIFRARADARAIRIAFIAGLLAGGVVLRFVHPGAFDSSWTAPLPLALVAGVIVGFGTQLGNGCTSGHGVCGISRLSIRSLVATGTFMATGILTVFVVRHVLGGHR